MVILCVKILKKQLIMLILMKKNIDDFGGDWFQEEISIPIVIRIDYDSEIMKI